MADGADYVEVVLARPDRADVLLGIKYHPPQVQFARFPDRVLIATVTDPGWQQPVSRFDSSAGPGEAISVRRLGAGPSRG